MTQLGQKDKEAVRRRQERFREEQVRRQEAAVKIKGEASSSTRKRQMLFILGTVLVIALFAAGGYAVYASRTSPGPLDDFAKCLTSKGLKVYGAIEWCHFTQEQAGMFGPSWRYVNYHDFQEDRSVKLTPTWKLGDKYYEKVQSLDRLAALTGCKLPWEQQAAK